jgi:mono/diheme cytochrome c family protein
MNQTKSWFQIIRWKLVIAVLAAILLWVGSGQLGFPRIFQWMFMGYSFLGFVIFVILDAPPLKGLSGWKAGVAVIVFYLACSGLYVAGAMLLPQFNPQTEIDGIARKTAKYRQDPAMTESLLAKTRELSAKADQILARLAELEASGQKVDLESIEVAGLPSEKATTTGLSGMDLVERGKLVYQDHECYNCHKIGGKGGKKRGPELDNIGNLVTADQLKKKIFDPKAFMAEGYENRKKDKMPDKFADVMSEEELEALVTYLMTLKNPAVKTPKPIFPAGS